MRKGLLKWVMPVMLLLGLFVENAQAAPGASAGGQPDPSRASVLAEDWASLARRASPALNEGAPAASRATAAYALLHENRGNEAFRLFLSLDGPDRTAWLAWTQELVAQHPDKAVAHFLAGDALARSGDFDGALRRFEVALGQGAPRIAPMSTRALALVAKGSVLAQQRHVTEARKALIEAIAANDRLAEAHASLGNLMVLQRAYPRALTEFKRAIELSPGYVVALGGLACANYGQGKWELADAELARAQQTLPLPHFAGNRRALLVAEENTRSPDLHGSPYFRFSDFLDWPELVRRSAMRDEVMNDFVRKPLPESLDGQLLAELNARLADADFASRVRDRLDLSKASQPLLDALGRPAGNPPDAGNASHTANPSAAQLLNRLILEHVYPDLVARHAQRDPGFQLTLTKGIIDQKTYKDSLDARQLTMGQARVDHLWKPMANLVRSTGFTPLAWAGDQWLKHLDRTTETNKPRWEQLTGDKFDRDRPSGALADLRTAFVQEGPWPVVNWFGLAYATPMEPQK